MIHETAEVSENAKVGKNTKIWHYSQIREDVVIGDNCIIGKNVYIDKDVTIGNNVKVQNNCSIYSGVTIEDGVFIGPHTCFSNDKFPRAVNPDMSLKKESDWKIGKIYVKNGASIGAGCIVLPDITIGSFAMIGTGSVVTKDIGDYTLAYGNPIKVMGKVDKKGNVVYD